MRKYSPKILLFSLLTFSLPIIGAELALRSFIAKSALSYGKLLGLELPPVKVIPYAAPPDRNLIGQNGSLVVKSKKISNDDIWGRMRPDPALGYSPEENSTSVNKWWQTNSIGARSRLDISTKSPLQKHRILIFGDSYAQGYGLPQEETFAAQLQEHSPNVEVVNFGVAGFGLGQSFLRFQQVQNKIQYDTVLLMLIPRIDLWRDLNTIRYLGEGWQSFTVLPRFVLENNLLKLIKSPYQSPNDVYKENSKTLTSELADHLEKYDRFFVRSYHDTPHTFLQRFVLVKLFTAFYWKLKLRGLKATSQMYQLDSEHMLVAKKIIDEFKATAKSDNRKFILVVYPSHEGVDPEVTTLLPGSKRRKQWDKMISFLESDNTLVLDLLPGLQSLGSGKIDFGYDGTHLGPEGSKAVAELIRRFLLEHGIFENN